MEVIQFCECRDLPLVKGVFGMEFNGAFYSQKLVRFVTINLNVK